jgi:hypothetical protein
MPYWTNEDELALIDMAKEGRSLDELCEQFKRSPEAMRLKLRRLGLEVPNSQKEVGSTTTLEPIKPAENLISVEEAAKMALGCIQRLNEKGLTALEIKRVRLIISALKGYIVLYSEYVERISEVEKRVEELNKVVLSQLEEKVAKAESDADRQFWQERLKEFTEKTAEEKPYTVWKRRMVKRDIQANTVTGRR